MSKKRFINTKFRSDGYILDLDPSEKLLFIYYLTNDHTDLCGMYELPIRKIAFETGFDKDMISKVESRFAKDGKIQRIGNRVYIINFWKHQTLNPSIKKWIQRSLKLVPEEIKSQFISNNTTEWTHSDTDYIEDVTEWGQTVDSLGTESDILKPWPKLKPWLWLKKSPKGEEQAPTVYGDPDVNMIIEKIWLYNGGIVDGTKKEQRRYWKMLLDKIKEIPSVQQEKYTAEGILEMILKIIEKNEYHSHKIVGPKKLFYNLAWLMQVCKQELEKTKKSAPKEF